MAWVSVFTMKRGKVEEQYKVINLGNETRILEISEMGYKYWDYGKCDACKEEMNANVRKESLKRVRVPLKLK